MNVLELADFSAPFLGSFGMSQLKLASHVMARGHTFRICLPEQRPWVEEFNNIGAGVHIVPVGGYPTSRNLRNSLAAIVEEHEIDLVHTHFGIEHLLSMAILKRFRFPGLKLVHHWRGGPVRDTPIKRVFGTILYQYIGRNLLAAQIANSQVIYKQIDDLGFAAQGRLMCVHNGIDTEHMSKETASDIRHTLEIPEDAVVILHVRNFRKVVDFNLVVRTFIDIGIADGNAYFVLVGDGERKEEIANKLHHSPIGNRVRFTGIVTDVANYYHSADLTLSSWEPWCGESINNSVYESLAMETPVLGVDEGALPNMFDETHAVFVSPPDPGQMSRKALSILAKRSELASVLENARKTVMRFHSLDSWASRIVEIYESL